MGSHHNGSVDRLMRTILALRTEAECQAFFSDLCTMKELTDLSQRLEVALLLRAGRTYLQVEKATGASSATISRVKRSLDNGRGGYETVFSRMEAEDPEATEVRDAAEEKKRGKGS